MVGDMEKIKMDHWLVLICIIAAVWAFCVTG
jgi:hypothetical protein